MPSSRFMGGRVGGYLILHRNVFVERIIPSGVKRKKLSPEVMNAYRGPFAAVESRRPEKYSPLMKLSFAEPAGSSEYSGRPLGSSE